MSKLIDRFKKISEAPASIMGFRTNRVKPDAARLVLIASVTAGNGDVSPETVKGAHAALIRPANSRLTGKAVQAAVKPLDDIPWGIAYSADKPVTLPTGCDFVLMSASGRPAAAPKDENAGRLLEVESSMDDGLLRAVNDLPVDAVVVTDSFAEPGGLNWHQLMIFRHLTHLLSIPVIVPVPAGITGDDLKALWDAGIDGVLVEAEATAVNDTRKLIDELPARALPKKNRAPAVLPRAGFETSAAAPEPDEEEEEEDDWD